MNRLARYRWNHRYFGYPRRAEPRQCRGEAVARHEGLCELQVGGGNRARTGDLLAASQTLSQLSYTPTAGYAGPRPATVEYTIAPWARNSATPSPQRSSRRRGPAPGILGDGARRRGPCGHAETPRAFALAMSVPATTRQGTAEVDDHYRPQEIERRWQRLWRERDAYRTPDTSDRPKFYCLDFFPYPSGDGLSVGHCRNYVPTDLVSRFKRMRGFNVLHPMGWDAFGLPAENYAIKMGVQPAGHDRAQHRQLPPPDGPDRAVVTTGRARSRAATPTTTAGPSGSSCCCTSAAWPTAAPASSGGARSTRRSWPTSRSNRAAAGAAAARSPRSTSSSGTSASPTTPSACWTTSRRSTGPSRSSSCSATGSAAARAPRSTSPLPGRPDTLTRLHHAARHALRRHLHGARARASAGRRARRPPEQRAAVEAYQDEARRESEIERLSTEKEKTGVFTGAYAINPVNGEQIPIWIADYVLMGYGTGAIMAVPAHDERDFEFATKFGLPIVEVIAPPAGGARARSIEAYTGDGVMVNSGEFDGLAAPATPSPPSSPAWPSAARRAAKVNYKLRDWLISRQRYWGVPDPDRLLRRTAASCRCRTSSCRCCCPSSRTTSRPTTGRSPLARDPDVRRTRPARAAAGRPSARPTRWTPSSARRGISSAYPSPHDDTAAVRPRRRSTTGCRSTSTSAAPSTP